MSDVARAEELELRAAQQNWSEETMLQLVVALLSKTGARILASLLPKNQMVVARAEELELRAAQQYWSKETLLPTAPE